MITGSLGTISNAATWEDSIQITDEHGDLVDLTDCEITMSLCCGECCSPDLTGSTTDGKVFVVDTGIFGWRFDAPTYLCPGTYRVSIIVERDGDKDQFLLGTIAVLGAC